MPFNYDRDSCDCCAGITLIVDDYAETQGLTLPVADMLDIAFHHATETRRALSEGKLVGTLDATLVALLDGMLVYREALTRIVHTHVEDIGDEEDKERALALAEDLIRCSFMGSAVSEGHPDKVQINLDNTFTDIGAATDAYDAADEIVPTYIEA